jgi:Type II intron maturase
LNWVFRYSLLATLAAKFKSSLNKIIDKYSVAPKVEYTYFNVKTRNFFSGVLASYPNKEFFNNKKKIYNPKFLFSMELSNFLKVKSMPIRVT